MRLGSPSKRIYLAECTYDSTLATQYNKTKTLRSNSIFVKAFTVSYVITLDDELERNNVYLNNCRQVVIEGNVDK